MKIQFVALGLLAFSGLTWSVQANIAPARFTGSGIVARSETGIRMQRAVVDIVWGMPCELTATFEMVNSSGASKDMRMGFPMPSGEFESRPTTVPDDLTITFDGVPADVTPPGGGTANRTGSGHSPFALRATAARDHFLVIATLIGLADPWMPRSVM
jgi:hypothetical protein